MISLVYVSTVSRPIKEAELIHILDVARARNSRQNVSGILLYSGGRFFQVLEGDETDVLDIYHDIAENKLHRSPVILYQESIEERTFGDWSMGYRHIDSESDKNTLEGYCAVLDQDISREEFNDKANMLVDMIYQFKSLM